MRTRIVACVALCLLLPLLCSCQPELLDENLAVELLTAEIAAGARSTSDGGKWASAIMMELSALRLPVEIEGVTDGATANERLADFVVASPSADMKFVGKAVFRRYDDGWRLSEAAIMGRRR